MSNKLRALLSTIHYVNTNNNLERCIQQLIDSIEAQQYTIPLNSQVLALDTEFIRTRHFYAQPALIQLGWQANVYLIDAQAIAAQVIASQLKKLYKTLAKCFIPLAIHAPPEDLSLLNYMGVPLPFAMGVQLFDSQWAAHTLKLGPQLGLFGLADICLNIKGLVSESRSDWLARPLTWQQLHYAAQDASLLNSVARYLMQGLLQLNMLQQHYTDMQYVHGVLSEAQQLVPLGLQSKIAHRVGPHNLPRFVALVNWRETAVQDLNIPRRWHLHDLALARLAKLGDRQTPPGVDQIEKILKYSKELISLPKYRQGLRSFQQSMELSYLAEQFYKCWRQPALINAEQLNLDFGPEVKPLLKKMSQIIEYHAKLIGIPSTALCPKSWLLQFINVFILKLDAYCMAQHPNNHITSLKLKDKLKLAQEPQYCATILQAMPIFVGTRQALLLELIECLCANAEIIEPAVGRRQLCINGLQNS